MIIHRINRIENYKNQFQKIWRFEDSCQNLNRINRIESTILIIIDPSTIFSITKLQKQSFSDTNSMVLPVCKLAVEVIFITAKTCFKCYKATKKPGVRAPDQN